MGFAVSWIAVKGKSKNELLAELRLRDSGEEDEAYDTPISGATLPDGWYVVFLNKYSHPLVEEGSVVKLSANCQVIVCLIEEHVMASLARLYENGLQVWEVSHQGDEDISNLETSGTLPARFAGIRNGLMKQQREEGGDPPEVDFIFDIPLDLAESICGYRHDKAEFDFGEPHFTALVPTK
jgi:hypothetical protein